MFKNKTSKFNDIARQSANVIFALCQILTGYFLTYFNIGMSIQSQSDITKTPIVPAGYTFSIWGFIFLFSLLYAVYQAFPSNRENELLRKIGWGTARIFLFNTIWILVAQLISFSWPTLIAITPILICSLMTLFKISDHKKALTTKEKWLVYVPFSTQAGWVSFAFFANMSSVLRQVEFGNFGLSETAFAILILFFAGAAVKLVLYRVNGNILYGSAVIWALIGIIVANIMSSNDVIVVTCFAMITAILIALFFIKKQKKENLFQKLFGRLFA